FGYEQVRERNPRLIYCSITGFGATGPYAHRPSYDTVGQALSGLMSLLVDPDNPHPIGPAFADNLSGLFAAYGVLAALNARNQSGMGQRVETTMLGATLGMMHEAFGLYYASGEVPGPTSRPRAAQVYAFTCGDGLGIALHLSSPSKFWQGLVRTL